MSFFQRSKDLLRKTATVRNAQKAADFAHRLTVVSIISFAGYHLGQIGYQFYLHRNREPIEQPPSYIEELKEQIDEASRRNNADEYSDFYEDEDKSFMKNMFRPLRTKPEFKKKPEGGEK